MSALEAYQGKVEGLLIEAAQHLSSTQLREPWNLVEHGEPAEGLAMLAWVISEGRIPVDRHIIEGIRSMTEGLLESDDLPSDLDTWVLPTT